MISYEMVHLHYENDILQAESRVSNILQKPSPQLKKLATVISLDRGWLFGFMSQVINITNICCFPVHFQVMLSLNDFFTKTILVGSFIDYVISHTFYFSYKIAHAPYRLKN